MGAPTAIPTSQNEVIAPSAAPRCDSGARLMTMSASEGNSSDRPAPAIPLETP